MLDLSKEITRAKFDKFSRSIFAITTHTNNGHFRTHGHFLTKDSAYKKMESIRDLVARDGGLDWVTNDDLDVRPTTIATKAGYFYELITIQLEY